MAKARHEEPIEPELIDDLNEAPLALAAISKAEIDVQIATAKKYPRDIAKFVDEAASLCSMTPDIAGDCFYRLERTDQDGKVKIIEGPSARLAEIVLSTWKNNRAGARIIEVNDRFVVAQGVFFDLERNVAVTYETRRRITNKYGKRFSEDMIGVTANAACSIALRNAVFKGVPKVYWEKAYEQAVKTFKGNAATLAERRQKMVEYFNRLGVSNERIAAKVKRQSVKEITIDDLVILRGIANAVKEGEQTLEEAFPERPEPVTDELAEKLERAAGEATTAETATDAEPEADSKAEREPERKPTADEAPEGEAEDGPEGPTPSMDRQEIVEGYAAQIGACTGSGGVHGVLKLAMADKRLGAKDRSYLTELARNRERQIAEAKKQKSEPRPQGGKGKLFDAQASATEGGL